ncbi:TPA: hypothetical protein N0F65_003394 [Lagenidium giganteum]|uniref:folate gamma-glutamyl hydrolase n=1 Tax=Lagenidium giganteum TaxID=4803 RepID=A0AAV2YVM7_9STRA|nr:TPA: hypothetical protein N0F65_003394 [Lagenidium giganteum]
MAASMLVALVATFAIQVTTAVAATATSGPIIGVFAQPVTQRLREAFHANADFISLTNVQWLEAAGARVVPIPYNAPVGQLDKLLSQLNGVMFPGGEVDVNDKAAYVFKRAVEMNDNGVHFPVWGTCLGFQWLFQLAANDLSALEKDCYDSMNLSLPLEFTADAKQSRLFGQAGDDINTWLATLPLTQNSHHDGTSVEHFRRYPALVDFFTVLATNEDRQGRGFISAVEARRYPIYGVQFHPEKNAYDYVEYEDGSPYRDVDHSPEAIKVAQYFANFFVQEARKNGQKFADPTERHRALIYNYRARHIPSPILPDAYFFFDFPPNDNTTSVF